MSPELYQAADHVLVKSFLADATLATNLAARTANWRGFFGPMDNIGSSLTTAAPADEDPAAGAEWILRYTEEPTRAFSDNVVTRRAALDVLIRMQPGLDDTDDAYTLALNIVSDLKASLVAQATAEATPNTARPVVGPVTSGDNAWTTFRLLTGYFLGETA